MKWLQIMLIGFLVLGLSSSAAFAEKGHDDDAMIALLRSSAAALQTSRADLAADLTAFANEEAQEEADEAKGIKEPVRSDAERTTRRQAHLKLLRDAAAALQTINPKLSKGLTKTADVKAKKFAKKK